MQAMVKVALLLAAALPLAAQTPSELERRVQQLEERIRQLEATIEKLSGAQPPAPAKPAVPILGGAPAAPAPAQTPPVLGGVPQDQISPPPEDQLALRPVSVSGDYRTFPSTETRLPVAGYMDFHVNRDSGDPWRPDFHRFVLLFGHSFNDRVKFWSELELEHSLLEGAEETGEFALEQAYLDLLITPKFNFRGGMLLTPIGIVNERHEPPSFNGVERPFVETLIIPTTWRELGFGITGDLGRGFRYRAYLTSQLDASFFNAESGITEGRSAGFDASLRNPARTGRLEYSGVRRLTLGTSFYSGHSGFNTPGVNPRVDLYEFDGRYSTGRFDFRGLFAHTWVSRAAELNRLVQLQTGVNPNVASQMRGWYVEPAVHVFPRRSSNDLIAFARYERYNTQHKMPAGYVPLEQFNRHSWVTGITYKPNADVALKFDYSFNRNRSRVVPAVNGINLGIGWWF
jgi:hypothetical protein